LFADRATNIFQVWNRKLHYYLGLYFLFFVWLFAFTGLLINHSSWTFAQFFPNRKVTAFDRQIDHPPNGGDFDQARDIMRQLGIEGEIEWPTPRSSPGEMDFQVTRPGVIFALKTDLQRDTVKIQRTEYNAWGIMRTMHTFTGVSGTAPDRQRDWYLTTVWALSMDAVAAGVLVMVFGGLYMWYGLKGKRTFGLLALGLGIASCVWLVFGLQWLNP
jgi:hypothetical protein